MAYFNNGSRADFGRQQRSNGGFGGWQDIMQRIMAAREQAQRQSPFPQFGFQGDQFRGGPGNKLIDQGPATGPFIDNQQRLADMAMGGVGALPLPMPQPMPPQVQPMAPQLPPQAQAMLPAQAGGFPQQQQPMAPQLPTQAQATLPAQAGGFPQQPIAPQPMAPQLPSQAQATLPQQAGGFGQIDVPGMPPQQPAPRTPTLPTLPATAQAILPNIPPQSMDRMMPQAAQSPQPATPAAPQMPQQSSGGLANRGFQDIEVGGMRHNFSSMFRGR